MATIRFTLNGRHVALGREVVESRLTGVVPEAIRQHGVFVNNTWFPVKQAFEVATGIPRSEFISHTARRHLIALGFDVKGEIVSRAATVGDSHERHTEEIVQAAVAKALTTAGWRIVSAADTATRERGVDLVAERGDSTVGVEVKGYPSRGYADPARAGELKPTAPSTQAGHWFAQALLAAMRLRGRQPDWRSAIALPDLPRYRNLHSETAASFEAAKIEVWWVQDSGSVDLP